MQWDQIIVNQQHNGKERKVPIKLTEHQIDEIIRLGSAFKKEFRFRMPSKLPNNYDKDDYE
jgi:hypothetical protein